MPDLDINSILPPGVIEQRTIRDGLFAAWTTGGDQPLTEAQIVAVTGQPPAPLTTIPFWPWNDKGEA